MPLWWSRLSRKVRWWLFNTKLKLVGPRSAVASKPSSRPTRLGNAHTRATTRGKVARPRSRWWIVKWLFILGLVGGVLGTAGLAGIFLYYGMDPALPGVDQLKHYAPLVVTKVVDRSGELLGEIASERRTVVPREKIPPAMVHAIVDAEDAQFFRDSLRRLDRPEWECFALLRLIASSIQF